MLTNVYVLTALACVGGLLFGFDIASMSAILSTNNYKVYFAGSTPVTDDPAHPGWLISSGPNSDVQGGITAAMPAGSWLGAIVSGILTDWIGRRQAIGVGCFAWIIGSILCAAAQNTGMLIVGRIINGFCVGIASSVVPVYLSELAPVNVRGRLSACQQWAITWGICIFFFVSLGCSYIGNQDGRSTASWRTAWGLQMIPAVILLGFLPFMPRSPRWLASKGRYEEALHVLAAVHAKGDENDPTVVAELKQIRDSIEAERSDTSPYLNLLKGNLLWRLHIAVFTQIWSQLSGMNVMMYYIGYIFQMAGVEDTAQSLKSSSVQYCLNIVMTIPTLLYIDRWGRRPLLLAGSFLMALFLAINAGILGVHGVATTAAERERLGFSDAVSSRVAGSAGTAMIAISYLFVCSFAPTWGPVSWVYPPELFTSLNRGKAVSIATSANWAFNAALSFFVPPSFRNLGYRTYVYFAVFNVLSFIHVFFAFPETKGLTLEEVDTLFASHTPAWRSRSAPVGKLDEMAHAVARGDDLEGNHKASSPSSEEKVDLA